jgi:hypothetical protein
MWVLKPSVRVIWYTCLFIWGNATKNLHFFFESLRVIDYVWSDLSVIREAMKARILCGIVRDFMSKELDRRELAAWAIGCRRAWAIAVV